MISPRLHSRRPLTRTKLSGPLTLELDLALVATPSETAVVLLNRTQVGERVFRLTGAGLYRDTVLLGAEKEIPTSVTARALEDVQSGSAAQDSLQLAVFKAFRGGCFGYSGIR